MKSYTHLYDRLCAFENLLHAATRAQRGKRFTGSTARFNFFLERELLCLQQELLTQTYHPGPYTTFTIREPKTRLISAAPYRDRVVHHALCAIIEPLFERAFIYDSYACRTGKGTHAAVERFSQYCRRYPYVLKADIAQFFPSIDHELLFGLLTRTIRDQRTRWLMRQILDASNPQPPALYYFPGDDLFTPITRRKGLPIGHLTSQLFANIYLNGFDHFVQETLRCPAYLRYCDDFVVFSADKRSLWQVKDAMTTYLASLRLRLHATKCQVLRTQDGVDFLGYRIFPTHRLLRQSTVRRFRRRLLVQHALYGSGLLSFAALDSSVQSWLGHASHAATYGLRRHLFRAMTWRRLVVPLDGTADKGQAVPGRRARRGVEH